MAQAGLQWFLGKGRKLTELLAQGSLHSDPLVFYSGAGRGRGVGRDCRMVTAGLALTPRLKNPGGVLTLV